MKDLFPIVHESILANLRQRIWDRQAALGRNGNWNTNSHLKHLHVMHLSDIIDEAMLGEYLEHLNEVDR